MIFKKLLRFSVFKYNKIGMGLTQMFGISGCQEDEVDV